MSKNKHLIKWGKISWVVSEDYLVAFDKLQATMYYTYDLPSRTQFELMKKEVLGKELKSWVDVIELALKYDMVGHGARLRDEWFES